MDPLSMKDAQLFGEAVSASFFDRGMEWVDYHDASDRITMQGFLARWYPRSGEKYDRVGYCMMDENADIFILATEGGKMSFRAAYDPDQVLVPTPPSSPSEPKE